MLGLGLILCSSVVMFFKISDPKVIIDNSGSNLIYEFRRINMTAHQISDMIDEINNEKYKIPIDIFGIFQITNIIQSAIPRIEQDVLFATDFSENMMKNPNLTNYSISLTFFFISAIFIGVSTLSLV